MLADIYQTKAYDGGSHYYHGAIQAVTDLANKMDDEGPPDDITSPDNMDAEGMYQLILHKSPTTKTYEEDVAKIQLKMIDNAIRVIQCIKIGSMDHQKLDAEMTLAKHKLIKHLKKEYQVAEKQKVAVKKKEEATVGDDDDKPAMVTNDDNNDATFYDMHAKVVDNSITVAVSKQSKKRKPSVHKKKTTDSSCSSKKKLKRDIIQERPPPPPQIISEPLVIPETEDVMEQKPIQLDVSDDDDWETTA
jgi:hypothetical protein